MAPFKHDIPESLAAPELLNELPDCVLQIALVSGKVLFVGNNFPDQVGFSAGDFKHIQDLLDLQRVADPVTWQQVNSSRATEWILDVTTRFGTRRWISLRGKADPDRNVFVGVLTDCSASHEREQLSTTLIDSVALSGQEIFVFDTYSGILLYANSTAETNLHYSLADLQKLSLDQYYRGGTEGLRTVIAALREEGSHESRHVLVREDGSEYDLVANGILQGPDQSQLVLVGRDQTSLNRLRRMEEEIRDRYRRALQGSETDIWEWDIRNDRFNSSSAVADWLGVAHDELSGTSDAARKYVHPADIDRFGEIVTNTIFSGASDYLNEYRLLAPSGEIIWIQARGKVQRDANGRATMLSGTTTNITERKQAQKELHNQISTLAAVLDNIADGIIAVNGDGLVTMINPKAVSVLRRSREELLGQTVLEFIELHGIDVKSWSSVADGVMREADLTDGHGSVVPIEFAVSEARLVEQDLYIVVFRDITGRKRFEKEILYAKERAEYAAKAKTDFLATMSHEIRTPLNGILGMAQLLLDTGLNAEQFETARVIHSSGEALLTIINDVLDFSKIDAGKLEVESELFDLRTVISDVLDIVQSRSQDSGVPMLLDYPLDLAHRVYGDAGRIKQVLLNLLGNAVKFTQQGSIKVTVRTAAAMTARQDWQRFEFSVEDTGIGIAKELHEQLFESFRQADVSTTRKFGGTGLGLAICKQLVELMGGEIGLESEPDVGTRFWFRVSFPIDDVAANPILVDRFPDLSVVLWHPDEVVATGLEQKLKEAGAKPKRFTQLEQLEAGVQDGEVIAFISDLIEPSKLRYLVARGPDFHPVLLTSIGSKHKQIHQSQGVNRFLNLPIDDRQLIALLHRRQEDEPDIVPDRPELKQEVFDGLRILLAEDNVVNQKVISRMLAKQGCQVDVAENGNDAVNMSDSEVYDLIFMDLRMPEKDGIEAVMDIRRRELKQNLSRIPIVAMTANAMGGDRDACLDAGMDDYVSKPVQIATLTEVLERWGKPH